jgi:hypothetical protein
MQAPLPKATAQPYLLPPDVYYPLEFRDIQDEIIIKGHKDSGS